MGTGNYSRLTYTITSSVSKWSSKSWTCSGAFSTNSKGSKQWSQTIQQSVDDNNVKLASDIDAMRSTLDAIKAALDAAGQASGTTVTQESVDAMTAQVARLDAMKEEMSALVSAPAP